MPTYGEISSGFLRVAPRTERTRLTLLMLGLGFVCYFTVGVPLILGWFGLLHAFGLEPAGREQLDAPAPATPGLLWIPSRWEMICEFFEMAPLWRGLRDLALAMPGILFGLFVGFGTLPMLLGRGAERRLVSQHFKHPKCLWCRYALDGLPAERGWIKCPECSKCNPGLAELYLDRHRSVWLRWPLRTLGRVLRARIPPSVLSPDLIPPRTPPHRSRLMLGLSLLTHLILLLVLMVSWIALLLIFWAAGEGTRWDYLTRLFHSGVPGFCALTLIICLPVAWPWIGAAIRKLHGFEPATSS